MPPPQASDRGGGELRPSEWGKAKAGRPLDMHAVVRCGDPALREDAGRTRGGGEVGPFPVQETVQDAQASGHGKNDSSFTRCERGRDTPKATPAPGVGDRYRVLRRIPLPRTRVNRTSAQAFCAANFLF
jgi:hypothetical protein